MITWITCFHGNSKAHYLYECQKIQPIFYFSRWTCDDSADLSHLNVQCVVAAAGSNARWRLKPQLRGTIVSRMCDWQGQKRLCGLDVTLKRRFADRSSRSFSTHNPNVLIHSSTALSCWEPDVESEATYSDLILEDLWHRGWGFSRGNLW